MMLHMRHPVDESLDRFMWRTQTKTTSSHNRHTQMSCKATATKIISAAQNMITIMAKKTSCKSPRAARSSSSVT